MTVTGVTDYVRGESVEFSISFADSDGDLANPTTATVYIAYRVDGVEATATVSLSETSGLWTGSWDSSVADAPDEIFWHVRTTGTPLAAEEGHFTLRANEANPDPS